MCVGTLADKSLSGLGGVLDMTGKLGIRDKLRDVGGNTKSKLSRVGEDVGINPTLATPAATQSLQQAEDRPARQSLINS